MKTTFKTIIVAAVAVAAAIACTKEFNEQNLKPAVEREKINVSIEALLGELTSADGTKATLDPVMRLHWKEDDTVFVYGVPSDYGDPDKPDSLGFLIVKPTDNKLNAKLETKEGNPIITPKENSKVHFIYWSGSDTLFWKEGSKLYFNLAKQDTLLFMAYGELEYKGENSLTDNVVHFNFATSLMRIAVTGLDPENKDVDSVAVSGLDSLLRFDLFNGEVLGEKKSYIRMGDGEHEVKNFTKEDNRALFYLGVVAGESNPDRRITIQQDSKLFGSKFTDTQIETSKCYTTVVALTEQTGSMGKIADYNYVYIAGRKWAMQNIYFGGSGTFGHTSFPQTNSVQVMSIKENLRIGDFFQWGAYEGVYNPYYEEGGTEGSNIDPILYYPNSNPYNDEIEGKRYNTDNNRIYFVQERSPFFHSATSYTHYSSKDGNVMTLHPQHDVANIRVKGTWRMPTKEDFQALIDSTVWVWSSVDSAFAVCPPGYLGKEAGTIIATNEHDFSFDNLNEKVGRDALLILPAAGYINNKNHLFVDEEDIPSGYYWTSSRLEEDEGKAYYLKITGAGKTGTSSQGNNPTVSLATMQRHMGLSVRAVSD